MKLKLAVLPGDGIGPEIMEQGLAVTEAICKKFGHELSYKYAICGADAIDKVGDPFPDDWEAEIREESAKTINQKNKKIEQLATQIDKRMLRLTTYRKN